MSLQVQTVEIPNLIPGRSVTRSLEVKVGASNATVSDGGTYSLYLITDGVESTTAAITATTTANQVTFTVPADAPVGYAAREEWSVQVDDGDGAVARVYSFYALVSKGDLYDPPVTNAEIGTWYAGYSTVPAGFTDWQLFIRFAWADVLRDLVNMTMAAGNAAPVNLQDLHYPCMHRILYRIATYDSDGGNTEALERAERHNRKYWDWFRAGGRIRFDTDADGKDNTGPAAAPNMNGAPGASPMTGGW